MLMCAQVPRLYQVEALGVVRGDGWRGVMVGCGCEGLGYALGLVGQPSIAVLGF